jgi:hypothetical protein
MGREIKVFCFFSSEKKSLACFSGNPRNVAASRACGRMEQYQRDQRAQDRFPSMDRFRPVHPVRQFRLRDRGQV